MSSWGRSRRGPSQKLSGKTILCKILCERLKILHAYCNVTCALGLNGCTIFMFTPFWLITSCVLDLSNNLILNYEIENSSEMSVLHFEDFTLKFFCLYGLRNILIGCCLLLRTRYTSLSLQQRAKQIPNLTKCLDKKHKAHVPLHKFPVLQILYCYYV